MHFCFAKYQKVDNKLSTCLFLNPSMGNTTSSNITYSGKVEFVPLFVSCSPILGTGITTLLKCQ